MMVFSKVFVLILCFGIYASQTESDVYTDNEMENDLLVFDFIYGCLSEYSEKVVSSLSHARQQEKHQISEECAFYPGFKKCLQTKSGNTYVDEFMVSLDDTMGFCECISREILLSTTSLGEAAYCRVCEEQVECLEPYSDNPFIGELLPGLDMAVKSERCVEAKKLDRERELEKERKKEEKRKETETKKFERAGNAAADQFGHYTEGNSVISTTSPPYITPDNIESPCTDRDHPSGAMTLKCVHWLYNNYHVANPGWSHCSNFTGSYNKKCGLYWAKCKKSGKTSNKNCCISIHCYGRLG